MITRHYFQNGHAPSRFHPRFARPFGVPLESPVCDSPVELERPATAAAEGRSGLRSLLKSWDRLAGPIPEGWIRDGLRSLHIDPAALWDCIHFHENSYHRTRIHASDHFEVLVHCWRPGQGSPIQDHGVSTLGFLVVSGVATEVTFMATACGRLAPSRSQRVHAGAVIVARGRDVHQLANLEGPQTNLVSLHVHSPPMTDHRCYRLTETIFVGNDALVDAPPAMRSAPI